MSLIESLEQSVKLLNEAYAKTLEVRFRIIRQSIPYKLLQEVVTEHNLHLYNDLALVRAEIHHPKFIVPRFGFGRGLSFSGEFNSDTAVNFGYLDLPTEPVQPFMELAGIKNKDQWRDYIPRWEEYLSMITPDQQKRVVKTITKFDLANLRLVEGEDCAALYWQESPGVSYRDIHSFRLGLKPRTKLSLRELIWTPKPKTEAEWRNAILRKYNGEDI